MRALIFANGDLTPGPLVDMALDAAPGALILAADGGARHAEASGLTPDVVIGDMDSLSADELARYGEQGINLLRFSAAKDETDLELAFLYAAEQGADWIRVIGGLGDRLDQSLGNVLLLTLPQLAGCDVRLVAGKQEVWMLPAGEHVIAGNVGDTLSLLPLGGIATGIVTEGLAYPLRDETLYFGPARGVSNVFEKEQVRVRVGEGQLLVVYTLGRA